MHIIENMPFHPQESYQCGPAALSMVLNYWGIAVSPEEIAKEIFSETARGTLNIDMLLFSQRKGMFAVQYRGSIDDLKKNIRSGYPVVVLVDYGFSLYKKHHYMVVYGYGENGLIINSGRSEKRYMKQETFLNLWEKAEYWTLLVIPEEGR
ncbi:MAG: C39 family peptidase [Nitrospirota bacterium]